MNLFNKISFLLVIVLMTSCSAEEVETTNNLENTLNNITTLSPSTENITLGEAVLIEVNNYRVTKGLSTVTLDINKATNLALEHSSYMVAKNQASHDNFYQRSSELSESGAISVSENIAFGYSNAQSIVNAWLNSPSHKEVLDGDFNYVGIGILTAQDNTNYCTALFYKK